MPTTPTMTEIAAVIDATASFNVKNYRTDEDAFAYIRQTITNMESVVRRTTEWTILAKTHVGRVLIARADARVTDGKAKSPAGDKWTHTKVLDALGITKSQAVSKLGIGFDSLAEYVDLARAYNKINPASDAGFMREVKSAVGTLEGKTAPVEPATAKVARMALNRAIFDTTSSRQGTAVKKTTALDTAIESGKITPQVGNDLGSMAERFAAFNKLAPKIRKWADFVKLTDDELDTYSMVVNTVKARRKASGSVDPDTATVTS